MKLKATIGFKVNALLIFAIGILGVAAVLISSNALEQYAQDEIQSLRELILQEKKAELSNLTQTAYNVFQSRYEESHDEEKIRAVYGEKVQIAVKQALTVLESAHKNDGLGSVEMRKQFALKTIESMRHGINSDEYFWINDTRPFMIMHPFKPELNGTDISRLTDPEGKAMFSEMAKVCLEQGSGFVDYMWPRPGFEKPIPKISYVTLFKPWGWIIGSGIYIESTQEQAIKAALAEINTLRYEEDDSGYFYTLDTKKRIMAQHPKASLVGKPDTAFKDTDGKQQIVEQVDIALSKGEGFNTYKWEKLGEKQPQPKLSFTKSFKPWDMAVITGIYIDDIDKIVDQKKKDSDARVFSQEIKLSVIVFIFIIVSIILCYFVVSKSIVGSIRNMIHMLRDIAEGEGDLTKRIDDKTGSETEEMGNFFNLFIIRVQEIVRDMSGYAGTLDRSSRSLTKVSQSLTESAEKTAMKANTVAAAGEEMSVNMNSVASAMEEASTNVGVVASASEEMSSTINEISQNTEKARSITDNAVVQTAKASSQVRELGVAATEIGNVLETITDISEQVNLLALNATIEAARAGEAGKGFAVVANEIKELANQTAEASGEIKARVSGIQTTTEGTVAEINSISGIVNDISEIVNTVATAVEEQSASTREIAQNAGQVSQGIDEVNENVAQSSRVSQEIANDISDVTQSSGEISSSSSQVNQKAEELYNLSVKLNDVVGKFKV